MTRTELEVLAREIAAVEGIPLAAALERATVELGGLVAYGRDWDRMAAEAQRSPIYRVRAA
jgi:hypothetical protein